MEPMASLSFVIPANAVTHSTIKYTDQSKHTAPLPSFRA